MALTSMTSASDPSLPVARAPRTTSAAADGLLQSALDLYDAGLNVFPQRHGAKSGFPWKPLQYTRLRREEIRTVLAGPSNLAVMAGRTSGNLFVIDCEDQVTFHRTLLKVAQHQAATWAVETARGGHIYLRCREGVVKNVASGIIPGLEVRGNNCYVLCPPSLHPTGVFYQWMIHEGEQPPLVSIDDIDWLVDHQGQAVRLKLQGGCKGKIAQHETRSSQVARQVGMPGDARFRQVSNTTLDYLEQGDTIPEGDRNSRLFKACCDLSGCGFSQAETGSLCRRMAVASGLLESQIAQTLSSAYSVNRTPSRPPGTDSFTPRPQDWQHARRYILAQAWPGRTGGTDRQVALALVHRAKLGMNEHGVFRATERELAEIARMSRVTVSNALQRLKTLQPPLLFQVGLDKQSGATLWRFSDVALRRGKVFCKTDPLPSLPGGGISSGSVSQNWADFSDAPVGDAAERGALGVSGMRLYRTWLRFEQPMRVQELAKASGLSIPTVYYQLKKLREYGIAVGTSRGYWKLFPLSSPEEMDERIARPAGTLGKGDRRHRMHSAERGRNTARIILRYRAKNDRAFELKEWKCPHCGHVVWHHRNVVPITCPRCHTP